MVAIGIATHDDYIEKNLGML